MLDKLDQASEMLESTLTRMKSDPTQSSVVVVDVQKVVDVLRRDGKATKVTSASVTVASPKRSPQMKPKDLGGCHSFLHFCVFSASVTKFCPCLYDKTSVVSEVWLILESFQKEEIL